ncbi:unnamed protein product [Adineta ricciae]|uniref:HIT domain-containing protein n=1 Tax=Adineta ricciae TaxID=249248 RepID=A0A815HVH8_ADIRI|nr:unnamed protein product [Adineta ricciae]CAF1356830.1 unnamed protein product [Adineta ricciae]
MTSQTIPTEWLNPRKLSNEWIFSCATSLDDLVQTNRAASYFRQLVTLLETDNHILNYHLEIRHQFQDTHRFEVIIYFDEADRVTNPSPMPVCISCEPTNELSKISLISEQQHTRAWLDAQAREKLILTPIRHVERLSELIDDDGEMEAFWRDAVELIQQECDQFHEFYPILVLNHGTYRNHAHLHLKMTFSKQIWKNTIGHRYSNRISQIKQLLSDPALFQDCFGQQSNKPKRH